MMQAAYSNPNDVLYFAKFLSLNSTSTNKASGGILISFLFRFYFCMMVRRNCCDLYESFYRTIAKSDHCCIELIKG